MLSPAAVEEAVLVLLSHSDRAHEAALKLNGFNLFTTPTNQKLADTCLEYIRKYNQPPKAALEYLLENDFKRGEQGKLLRQQVDLVEKQANQVDAGFILEQLDSFVETRNLTTTLQNSLELLQEGELSKAKEGLFKVSSTQHLATPGLWMKDPDQALSFLKRDEETEFFSSGIDLLDQRGIRPERQTLTFMIAATGKGKSWFLVNLGKAALQHHKKVLHITLELSEEKTARRYLQTIFGLTKDQIQQIRIPRFSEINGTTTIDFLDIQRDSLLNKRVEIRQKINGWLSCPRWLVKQFPTGTLSTEQLVMFLDTLEKREGFKPDVVIIDYADIMYIDAKSLRIDTGRLYKELRGIAVEKNIAIVSATQGNRESETAKVVGTTNVAEDWSKIGTADTVLTYSQTLDEKKLGLARVFVGKARDNSDGFMCLISQAYEIGAFALDSIPMTAGLANQLQTL